MFYIILHHFVVHGTQTAGYIGQEPSLYGVVSNSFFVIAVNCFILISGYFGIKLSWKGVVKLYITIVFYILILNIFGFVYNDYFSPKKIVYSFLPFSRSPYWFISTYFYLLMLSPILNKAINSFTKKEFHFSLLSLSLLMFYYGYFWQGKINPTGYNVMNFIFLYFIARYIALHAKGISSKSYRKLYILLYVVCSLAISVFVFLIYKSPVNNKWIEIWGFSYNNPLVIVSSVLFLLLFSTFKIKSNIINYAASSALAIYLIHENDNIRYLLYDFINQLSKTINVWILFILFPLMAIAIIVISIVIDKFRVYITSFIEKSISNIPFIKIFDYLSSKYLK